MSFKYRGKNKFRKKREKARSAGIASGISRRAKRLDGPERQEMRARPKQVIPWTIFLQHRSGEIVEVNNQHSVTSAAKAVSVILRNYEK